MGATLAPGEIAFDRRRIVGKRFEPDMGDILQVQSGGYRPIAAGAGPLRRHQCNERRDADRKVYFHSGAPVLIDQ